MLRNIDNNSNKNNKGSKNNLMTTKRTRIPTSATRDTTAFLTNERYELFISVPDISPSYGIVSEVLLPCLSKSTVVRMALTRYLTSLHLHKSCRGCLRKTLSIAYAWAVIFIAGAYFRPFSFFNLSILSFASLFLGRKY